ncbi:hypothetical protein C2G38_2244868 [Gigaspora rosea]|uniref:Yeast cell wall synthesis Kre9/Knh1-like N-terminal domain-containing protein n=1 Tax=Gigaspora rosea TaxID=44941 RepID=A0A397VD60_9GLOM|nr:hypothetical protein C2G38_2244868 [Gigaspora rosea]
MMHNKLIITVLCLLSILASLLYAHPLDSRSSVYPDNVKGVQVTMPENGDSYDFGDKVKLTLYPDPKTSVIYEINLWIANLNRVHVFASNVEVKPGQENIFEFTLPDRDPSKNITDDARYHFGIYESADTFMAASSTFVIGSPKFGLTISKPPSGLIVQSGKPFTVKWSDNFNKYSGKKIVIHFFYFLGDTNKISEVPADLYTGIPVEDGTYDVTIPSSYPPHRDYVIVLGIIDVLRNGVTEHYGLPLTLVD